MGDQPVLLKPFNVINPFLCDVFSQIAGKICRFKYISFALSLIVLAISLCGLSQIQKDDDIISLYTSRSSEAWQQYLRLNKLFPREIDFAHQNMYNLGLSFGMLLYPTTKEPLNLLVNSSVLYEFYDFEVAVLDASYKINGENVGYRNVCLKLAGDCFPNSAIDSLLYDLEDYGAHIDYPTVIGEDYLVQYGEALGGFIDFDEKNRVNSTDAFRDQFYLSESNVETSKQFLAEFMKTCESMKTNFDFTGYDVICFTSNSISDEALKAVMSDIPLFLGGLLLFMISICILFLVSNNPGRSQVIFVFASCILAVLTYASSIGISAFLGFDLASLSLLGITIGTVIFMRAVLYLSTAVLNQWRDCQKSNVEEIVMKSMYKSYLPVLATLLCTAFFSFASSCSEYKVLSCTAVLFGIFCLLSLFTITFGVIPMLAMYCSLVTTDKHTVLCCIESKKSEFHEYITSFYVAATNSVCSRKIVQICSLIITALLFIVMLIFAFHIKKFGDRKEMLPSDSYAAKLIQLTSELYPQNGPVVQLVGIGDDAQDLTTVLNHMEHCLTAMRADSNVNKFISDKYFDVDLISKIKDLNGGSKLTTGTALRNARAAFADMRFGVILVQDFHLGSPAVARFIIRQRYLSDAEKEFEFMNTIKQFMDNYTDTHNLKGKLEVYSNMFLVYSQNTDLEKTFTIYWISGAFFVLIFALFNSFHVFAVIASLFMYFFAEVSFFGIMGICGIPYNNFSLVLLLFYTAMAMQFSFYVVHAFTYISSIGSPNSFEKVCQYFVRQSYSTAIGFTLATILLCFTTAPIFRIMLLLNVAVLILFKIEGSALLSILALTMSNGSREQDETKTNGVEKVALEDCENKPDSKI